MDACNCDCLKKCCADTAEKIRQAPLQSVALAGAAGFLLRFVPVFAILGALIRLALFLLKPALVVFGICKLTQLCRAKSGIDPDAGEVSDREFPRPVDPA